MLDAKERAEIIGALSQWASNAPDEPIIGFMYSPRLLTPHEIVAEVRKNTPDGQAVLELLEHGINREGIQKVLRRLTSTRSLLK